MCARNKTLSAATAMATRGEEATADELCAQAVLFRAASHLYWGILGLLRAAANVAAGSCAGGRRGVPGGPVRPGGVGTPADRHDPSGKVTRVPGGAARRRAVRAGSVGRTPLRQGRGQAGARLRSGWQHVITSQEYLPYWRDNYHSVSEETQQKLLCICALHCVHCSKLLVSYALFRP